MTEHTWTAPAAGRYHVVTGQPPHLLYAECTAECGTLADELLNRALLEILHDTTGGYRFSIDINPDLPWPDCLDAERHLEACPEAAITVLAGDDRTVGSCNVAIITMSVQCPHVVAAPAKLDVYGHLGSLLDEMHRIGEEPTS